MDIKAEENILKKNEKNNEECWDKETQNVILGNYNIIKEDNTEPPNYDISGETLYINIYINHDNNVVIIGEVDYNYAAWTSFTPADAYELNRLIIKHNIELSSKSGAIPVATHYSGYMSCLGLTEGKASLLNYYKVTISRSDGEINNTGGRKLIWKSTEGKSYIGEVNDIAGEIAKDIALLRDDIRRKLRTEECPELLDKLNDYKKNVDKCKKNFSINLYEELIWSIKNELNEHPHYVLSENNEIRDLYCELIMECYDLYCLYRSLTH